MEDQAGICTGDVCYAERIVQGETRVNKMVKNRQEVDGSDANLLQPNGMTKMAHIYLTSSIHIITSLTI